MSGSARSARIDLLERIDMQGSIALAASDVGLSPKAARDAVDTLNNLSEEPLLIRAPGSQHGGGYLTEDGRKLVHLFRRWQAQHARLAAPLNDPLLQAVRLRTSARNQLGGRVKRVDAGTVTAEVTLDLGDGLELTASVTNEAVEELDLRPGRVAVALIKASVVSLCCDAPPRVSARNRLRGTVTEVLCGPTHSEVKLQTPGGRVLAALLPAPAIAELDIVEGSECYALIDSWHVLLAVND